MLFTTPSYTTDSLKIERKVIMLKKMKIRNLLISSFLITTLFAGIGGVIGLIVMNNITAQYQAALRDYGFAQGSLGSFGTEFNNNRVILRELVAEENESSRKFDQEKLDESTKKLQTALSTVEKSMTNAQETEQFSLLKQDLAQYTEISTRVVGLANNKEAGQAKTTTTQVATPLATKICSIIDKMNSQKTSMGNQIAQDLARQESVSTGVMLGIILVSFLLSVVISVKISKFISGPLQALSFAANKMAEGNLNAEITVDMKNEIGELAESFNKTSSVLKAYIDDIKTTLAQMAQGNLDVHLQQNFKGDFAELRTSIRGITVSFSDALRQMAQAAEQVSAGSMQVADGSQALAQGATEQASSVQELTATIEEISSHVKDNATHAVVASQNVADVGKEIETSNQYMNEMTAAMEQIDESSAQIGKIIKAIEDIAFQTNILALNAAVEAARAGAAGKGFAVVADEVRNLASKSAVAAQDTTALIENSLQHVKNGTRIAEETAKSLMQVVEKAKAVTETVERISSVSKHQSDAIIQVTQGIEQISAVVQTNSATAEESAAASEELSGQAQTLNELVQKFQLRESKGATSTSPRKPELTENLTTRYEPDFAAESIPEESTPDETIGENNKY